MAQSLVIDLRAREWFDGGMTDITPCIWLDGTAEQAADLYISLFPNSERLHTVHYPTDPAALGPNADQAGQVMMESIMLDGNRFTLLNGGPQFPQTEAVSFEITCSDQADVDHYWDGLTVNGGSESQCGWCKDPFGVSWQVVPHRFYELMSTPDAEVVTRVSAAMFGMRKLVIAELEAAAQASE